MDSEKKQKCKINRIDFMSAFEHYLDETLQEQPDPYLDLETGEVVWIYEDDEVARDIINEAEENAKLRDQIYENSERYLRIESLDYNDHRDALTAFLSSDWTADDRKWQFARNAYSGAIGRWKRAVNDRDIVHAYYDYLETWAFERAGEFLAENGVEPEWR